jgi:hypothetical protein
VLAMCNSSKSCMGAAEDDNHTKCTVTRLFRVVMITFLFQSPTGICLQSKLDSEFQCFSGGSDLKILTSENQNLVMDSLLNSLGSVYCVLPYCKYSTNIAKHKILIPFKGRISQEVCNPKILYTTLISDVKQV